MESTDHFQCRLRAAPSCSSPWDQCSRHLLRGFSLKVCPRTRPNRSRVHLLQADPFTLTLSMSRQTQVSGTRDLWGSRAQEIHPGIYRLRLCFHRLRQRWLDRYLRAVRARGWKALRRRRRTASTRTIATARSPTSPRRPDCDAVGWASAVCIGDYNNDGFEDLFCTYLGQNVLYRNNGDGTFTDVTKAAGLLDDQHALGRGMHLPRLRPRRPLDLFVANYVDSRFEHAAVARREYATATGRGFR